MQIISLTSKNFQSTVDAAARAIQRGGVVVSPTDTVYGLLANATNKKAVGKVYQIKHRQSDKPLPIFVKNSAMADKLAKISPKNEKCLQEIWPGKVTAILPKRGGLKLFGVDKATVALRIPHYPFINSLLETLNLPLTGTSANISGLPASGKIDEVLRQLQNSKVGPDLIINAGDLPESKPSTIVDLTQKETKTIRR